MGESILAGARSGGVSSMTGFTISDGAVSACEEDGLVRATFGKGRSESPVMKNSAQSHGSGVS